MKESGPRTAPYLNNTFTKFSRSSSGIESGHGKDKLDDDFTCCNIPDDYSVFTDVDLVAAVDPSFFRLPSFVTINIDHQQNESHAVQQQIHQESKQEIKKTGRTYKLVCFSLSLTCCIAASVILMNKSTIRESVAQSQLFREPARQSESPFFAPSKSLSSTPSMIPSFSPPTSLTVFSSEILSSFPTGVLSLAPSTRPSSFPTGFPTLAPIARPSSFPTAAPSIVPGTRPLSISSLAPVLNSTNFPNVLNTSSLTGIPSPIPHLEPPTAGILTRLPVLNCSDTGNTKTFNAATRATIACVIQDVVLVLKENSEPFSFLHKRADIELLTIYADTVIVNSKLHLPQTTVVIYGRELIFDRHADSGDADSYIMTTPYSWEGRVAVVGGNGEAGQDAGNVTLNLKSISLNGTGTGPAFVLNGSRGQEQGYGKNGTAGADNLACSRCGAFNGSDVVYLRHVDTGSSYEIPEVNSSGEMKWPGNGENALAAGVPGRGGNGGTFTSTAQFLEHSMSSLVQVRGGSSGEQHSVDQYRYIGGRAGLPRSSVMLLVERRYNDVGDPNITYISIEFEGKVKKYTTDGLDAYNVSGFEATGNTGLILSQSRQYFPWLHPALLRLILEKAKAEYKGEYSKSTQTMLVEYVHDLDAVFSTECFSNIDRYCLGYPFTQDEADLQQGCRNEMDYILSNMI